MDKLIQTSADTLGSTSGTAPTNRLNINAATTADAAAQALISTGSTGNKGLVVQRVSGQTANLIEVQSDTGNVLARFSSGGVLGINNNSVGTQSKLSINPNSTTDNSAVAQINTVNTTDKGLVIQGVAGQTSHLLQIQTSAGAVASGFTASGALYVASGSIYGNSALSLATGSASNQGVIIRGQASQTGNLMELQDNNGLVNGVFNAAGNQAHPWSCCSQWYGHPR